MKTKLWKLTLLLSLLALTACAGNVAASLDGTSWQLVDFAGKPLVPNPQPTLSFEEGRVSGNASCNTFGGEYAIKRDRIKFDRMFTTMMACADNAAMEQEQAYLAFLGSVERFELRDGQLLLSGADGETMIFSQVVED